MTNSGAGGPDPVEWPAVSRAPADPEETPGLAALRRNYRDWDIQPFSVAGLTGWIAVERPRPRFTAAMDLDELRVQMRAVSLSQEGGQV